jgi:hypothetical protein
LWLFDLDAAAGPTEPLLAEVRSPSVVWHPDGTTLYGSSIDPDKIADPIPADGPYPLVCWTLDLRTKVRTPLAIAAGHQIVDLCSDGKTLLTVRPTGIPLPPVKETYLIPLATRTPARLTEKPFVGLRFSPDGSRVLGTRMETTTTGAQKVRPLIVAVTGATESSVRVGDEEGDVTHACWSPDGKRIALGYASHVVVADPDGRNARVIARREEDQRIQGLDWR